MASPLINPLLESSNGKQEKVSEECILKDGKVFLIEERQSTLIEDGGGKKLPILCHLNEEDFPTGKLPALCY